LKWRFSESLNFSISAIFGQTLMRRQSGIPFRILSLTLRKFFLFILFIFTFFIIRLPKKLKVLNHWSPFFKSRIDFFLILFGFKFRRGRKNGSEIILVLDKEYKEHISLVGSTMKPKLSIMLFCCLGVRLMFFLLGCICVNNLIKKWFLKRKFIYFFFQKLK